MKKLPNQLLKLSLFALLACILISCSDSKDDPDPGSEIPLEDKMWLVVTTTENNQTVKLPLSGTVDCEISWDGTDELNGLDGNVEVVTVSYPAHTYENAGKHLILIAGTVTALSSYELDEAERDCITSVYNWGKTGLTSMQSAFLGCSNLTSIVNDDEGAFAGITSFSYAFDGCSSLSEIPAGLFKYAKLAQEFSNLFSGCSSLTEIPAGLFDKCTRMGHIGRAFEGCEGLTEIPKGLFDNCTQAYSFNSTFYKCKNLKEIPAGLFDNCPWADNFFGTFQNCESLTEIPVGLFDNSLRADTFSMTFAGCKNLTGESPYTVVDGKKVHLYERDGILGGFKKPEHGYNCFSGCSGLSDFSDILDNWK